MKENKITKQVAHGAALVACAMRLYDTRAEVATLSAHGTLAVLSPAPPPRHTVVMQAPSASITCLAMAPCCTAYAVGMADGRVRVARCGDHRQLLECSSACDAPTACALGPDGRLLAVGHASGVLRLYDCHGGEVVGRTCRTRSRVLAAAYTCDGHIVALGGLLPTITMLA